MTMRAKGVMVLAAQLALVLSVAGKYAWERAHCPMVWTRTMQYDPERVIRGRYLALTLRASACGLTAGQRSHDYGWNGQREWASFRAQQWKVVPAAQDGKLAPRLAKDAQPEETELLTQRSDQPCEMATLSAPVEFFVPEHEKGPFPLKPGEELWAQVTVPPSGPPRPVRLAVSDGKSWRVLDLR